MKKAIFYSLYILLFSLFFGCGNKKETEISVVKQEFYTVMPMKNYILDPHTYQDEYSRALIMQLWEGITELKKGGTKLVSANKIEHSEDFKTWTIELRKDLKWSNGEKIDAYTYVNSWLSALNNESVSDEIYRLFVIENAEKIFNKTAKTEEKLGVKVENEKLIVKLNTAVENFDEWLSNPIFYPIREENENLKTNELIVNGPFRIVSITDEEINLEKNQHYWDEVNTRLKKINIKLEKDEIMAYEMFSRMEIDFFGSPFYSLPFERRKQANSLPEKVIFEINNYSYISFPKKDNFLSLPEVRKNLYAVTDPEFMGDVIIQNSSPSIFEHIHPNSQLLENAKNDFLELKEKNKVEFPEGAYIAYSEAGKLLEKRLLLSTLKEWISQFKMPIRVVNSSEIEANFSFDTYLLGTNKFEDFYYYLNYKYQNSDKKLLIKSNEEFLEKLPVIPLNKINETVLVHSGVQGLHIAPSGDLYLKYVYMR